MTGAATARTPPTVEQERLTRQRELAVTLRIFARAGFDEGSGGHVTARDPQDPDRFWINPFGAHFAHVRARDLLCVDPDGTVVAGAGRVNPAGYAIHSALHAARPDVVSVAHVHSVHGRAWATLGLPLDPITQDSCAFYGDHAVHTEFNGVVLDSDEGRAIARTLGGAKAVILQNHGLLTVGASVGEAAWWFISMDRSCQIQLLAQAAGRPISLDPDAARASAAIMGTPGMGRFNFRPMYEHAVRLEPDALD